MKPGLRPWFEAVAVGYRMTQYVSSRLESSVMDPNDTAQVALGMASGTSDQGSCMRPAVTTRVRMGMAVAAAIHR